MGRASKGRSDVQHDVASFGQNVSNISILAAADMMSSNDDTNGTYSIGCKQIVER